MKLERIKINQTEFAEIISDDLIITTLEEATDLLGNIYYQGFDKVIIHAQNITPAFFDLKTKLAGEILQKFSTYRVQLIIIGDFGAYESKSLKDFMFESNKGKHVNFLESKEKLADAF
ncbi:alpha/beta hydrolase [Siphonobacter sp. SORGH_AS_0500]|uniref:DUF4180 domain-containing protein n=1 Tax=Siphonobacter sp. SORGH_AS_0500 TaxID=1864824 RepID=UPI000CBFB9C1|nr:DUF4180 domain-containing protein [Siphonobacter sp. SORGH_AS_0500]PKK35332.1 alpha/beta hydrolase [Siphonobacter sp. SORGH_AS_0500]